MQANTISSLIAHSLVVRGDGCFVNKHQDKTGRRAMDCVMLMKCTYRIRPHS